MGLILDTSVLIAAEKRQFDLRRLFEARADEPFFIAAITAAELLHGVERARPPARRRDRSQHVEKVLSEIEAIDFDLSVARRHAVLWAALEKAGKVIGAYDLLIAATALHHGYAVATLNLMEFRQVAGLRVIDPAPYRLR
jgi:predicted nucleic acid-binding protein